MRNVNEFSWKYTRDGILQRKFPHRQIYLLRIFWGHEAQNTFKFSHIPNQKCVP